MPLKTDAAATTTALATANWEARFVAVLSLLRPDGLRALANEADRLAGLAATEGRDGVALGELANCLRNRSNRLSAGGTL